MARAAYYCFLLITLAAACAKDTRIVGLNTSDGNGNVVGLGELKLGSLESELDKEGWTPTEYPTNHAYSKDIQVVVGGKARAVTAKLMFKKGKELRSMFIEFKEGSIEEVLAALRAEYGSAFPKSKHHLTDSYRYQDPTNNVVDLAEGKDGHPNIFFHWKVK